MAVYRVGGNKSSQNNFPSVRPTLDLDFANTRTLDPRITFTRASGGSYVGADGLIKYAGVNEARFDHDPTTGESLGLLIEAARTNLSLNSQDFTDNVSNVGWRISSSTSRAYLIANTGIDDPSGGTTASRWASGTTNVEELIYHITPSTLTFGNTYTASCWIRRVSGSGEVGFIIGDNAGGFVTSQLDSVPYGTWVRCHFSRTITGVSGGPRAYITVYPSNFFSGTPTTIDIWGYQMEEGAFPTSYIPTVASTRTRAADSASITGKNFSSWYRQDEGTLYTSHIQKNSTDTTKNWGIFSISNATLTSFIRLFAGAGSASVFNILSSGSGSSVYTTTNGSFVQDNIMRAVCSYSSSSAVRILNNNVPIEDTSVVLPSNLNNIIIGGGGAGLSSLNGTISRFTYYPKRLPNEQLIALTR